jgi:capsular exopolysaccharide synthesis family protein
MNEPKNLATRPVTFPRDEDVVSLERTNGNAGAHRGSYSYDQNEDRGSQLLDYWRIVRKHLWLIIGITVLIPTVVAIYMLRKPDIYESQARIQVDLENTNPLLGGMSKNSSVIVNSEANDPAYFNTQLQILTGPGLLRRVAKNLDLEHNQDFLRDYPSSKSSGWDLRSILGLKPKTNLKNSSSDVLPVSSTTPTTAAQNQAEAERLAEYVEDLQETLRVDPVKETRLTVRETRLIDVSYRHTDAHLAAKIVNTIAQTFVDENLEKKTENTGSTSSYLQKRIAELQTIIRGKEEELINYAKNHEILSLDASQNTVVERLNGLSKQLLEAENERKLAEAAYNASLRPGAAEALAEAGSSDREVPSTTKVTTEAEIKLAELKQKRAELLVENTEKWPAVKEVDKQIAALQKQISETRSRATNIVSTNLATRYRQALAAEQELRKAYDKQRAETLTQNEAAVNYRIIQQEIDTNKTLLDGLLQRTKENEVVAAGTPNNIRVVDYAIAGKKPVAPKRSLIVGMSVLLALGCGIGLAFFLEYLDDSVRSPDDIERYLRLPSIALIPQVGSAKQKRLARLGGKKDAIALNGRGAHEVLLTEVDKRSAVAEAYRHLRTSILLSTAGRPPKSLLITSSVPSEGKTTTAVNTAISLAQTGARVLLIDADMRRPRVHSVFNLSNGTGLSALLSREASDADISSAIQKEEGSGLYVLTSGPVPPNPAELIGSDQMIKLLSRLSVDFTHVVVDSPPVAAFTDGVLIGAMVEAVVLVVHSGKNSRKIVARARRLLQDVGARIIGVVLNKVETSGSHSYYYYSGYYSHYHYGAEAPADTGIEASA